MAQAKDETALEIDGRELVITHPDKLLIASSGPGRAAGVTKLALVNYYLAVAVAVAEGALRRAGGRPCMPVRYPNRTRGYLADKRPWAQSTFCTRTPKSRH
jgi:DNA primase